MIWIQIEKNQHNYFPGESTYMYWQSLMATVQTEVYNGTVDVGILMFAKKHASHTTWKKQKSPNGT